VGVDHATVVGTHIVIGVIDGGQGRSRSRSAGCEASYKLGRGERRSDDRR
jgi:hypothetical protein